MKTKAIATVMLTMFLLSGIMTAVPASGHSGVSFSAWTWTPPTIDGTIDTAVEWASAATTPFTSTLGLEGIFYVMNDGNNLYIAVRTTDSTLSQDGTGTDAVWIYFDNNNNGVGPEAGDDIIGWNGYLSEGFKDGYSDGTYVWWKDTDAGGDSDGSATATNDGTYSYFEISHPLDTTDDAHDFSLSTGDTIGFAIRFTVDGFNKGWWPSSDSSEWHDIEVASSIYQGDLILTGNDVHTIKGRFDINGSIIVEGNATLILKNAVVNFTQTTHWQYNMSFQNSLNGNPRLQAINTAIISTFDFAFKVSFFQNSSGSLLNCTIPWRGELHTNDVSTVSVTENSTMDEFTPKDNSILIIYNSTIGHVYLYDHCNVYVTDATVESFVDYSTNSYLSIWNSTLLSLDCRQSNTYVHNSSINTVWMKSQSINCSIKDFTVENVTFWNSLIDFSITISVTGYTANVTLENTRVDRWRFTFYGQSNVTVTNSTLTCLDAYGSSTMSVLNSTVDYIYSRGSSSVSISNSTIWQANSGDDSTMSVSSTTVKQFVMAEDYSILKLINTVCVVYRGFHSHASIYYCWYLSVHVIDSEGSDVLNAEVTAQYSNGTIAQQGTTNINGKVTFILAEKVWNDTGKCYFGNYTITATYESYSNGTSVNMTENRQITLTLEDFVVPSAIYIRTDGSVEPSTAPIQRDGNLYTLTDNVYLPIVVERDNIVVDGAGYTAQGTGTGIGINLTGTSNVTIRNMEIKAFQYGIWVYRPYQSSNNNVLGNIITNNIYGVWIFASNNTLSGNMITNNGNSGVVIDLDSSNNTISRNNIMNNTRGVWLILASNNKFYHNNMNNTQQVYISGSGYANFWDNGVEGNYWSDYTGVDSDPDGIGDSDYELNADNIDHCPLMGLFSGFNTSIGYYVNVISNSTIEGFQYFESNSTIKMYLSGVEGIGFCRVCIPYELMNVTNISVIIDDGDTVVLYPNYNVYDNTTHRWIYFAYEHSAHEVDIIPEFPSFLIPPLFMIVTLLAVIVCRRKAHVRVQGKS